MTRTASQANARTPLERAMASGYDSAAADRSALDHAASAKSMSAMASAFNEIRQRLDAVHAAVSRANPVSRSEQRAKPLILSALKYGARGYGELHGAFHSAATDPHGNHVNYRLKLQKDAAQNFKTAAAAGARARHELGGH